MRTIVLVNRRRSEKTLRNVFDRTDKSRTKAVVDESWVFESRRKDIYKSTYDCLHSTHISEGLSTANSRIQRESSNDNIIIMRNIARRK
jgi:hypothetical protein